MRSPESCEQSSAASTTRSEGGETSGVQGHRAVDLPVALEERHLLDAEVGEVGPDLTDPRLGVGLGGEPLVGVLLDAQLGTGRLLQPPVPHVRSRSLRGERRLVRQVHDSRTLAWTNGGLWLTKTSW